MNQDNLNHPHVVNQPGDEITVDPLGKYAIFGKNSDRIYLLLPHVGVVISNYRHAHKVFEQLGHNNKFEVMENQTQGVTWIGLEGSFEPWKPQPETEKEAGHGALTEYARQYIAVSELKATLRQEKEALKEKSEALYTALQWPHYNISSLFVIEVNNQDVGIVVDDEGEHNHNVILNVSNWSKDND